MSNSLFEVIDPSEYITVDMWEAICKEGQGDLVFHSGFDVDEVFGGPERSPCRLVTASCDAGPCYQAERHPNADLGRLAASVPWHKLAELKDGYHKVDVGPAVREGRCALAHPYLMKTERYSWCSFEDVPPWVQRWYAVSCDIEHERVTPIPFGLNDHGVGLSLVPSHANGRKRGLLYVNFQDNSLERVRLKHHYAPQRWLTFRPRPDLPVDTYLRELSEHQFALCPEGNGLDCYRLYECLYLGVVPIVQLSRFTKHLIAQGLPILAVDNLYALNPGWLEKLEEEMGVDSELYRLDWVKASYWRDRLAREAVA